MPGASIDASAGVLTRRWRSTCRVLVQTLLLLAATCVAHAASNLADPQQTFKAIQQATHERYQATLQEYSLAKSGDFVALAIAKCRFIESFTDADDLSWQNEASDDLSACQEDLQQRFPASAEAQLYLLGTKSGGEAVTYGNKLLPQAADWTVPQRAQLHTLLSAAYAAQKLRRKAGEEALAAVELDRNTEQLASAIEYLADAGRGAQAQEYLEAADAADNAFRADERLRAATRLADPQVALRELQRDQPIETEIDPFVAAKVYFRAGQFAQAQARIGTLPVRAVYETREQRQLRFDVALASADQAAAIKALNRSLSHPEELAQWMKNYCALLRQAPAALLTASLLPATAAALCMLLLLVLFPALLLVPVHYRGLLRRLKGRVPVPLFDDVGLRHAWIVLVAISVIPLAALAVVDSSSLQMMFGSGGSVAQNPALARAIIWSTLAGLLLLLPVWRHFAWQELLGAQRSAVKLAGMTLSGLAFVWICAFAYAGVLALFGGALQETLHTRAVDSVTRTLDHDSGTWVLFLVVAVLVPAYEELTFRGVVLGGLTRHISFGWANFWQATLFALAHDDSPRFVFYLSVGLVCGWLARRTRGLLAPFLLHALNNSIALALRLLLWSG